MIAAAAAAVVVVVAAAAAKKRREQTYLWIANQHTTTATNRRGDTSVGTWNAVPHRTAIVTKIIIRTAEIAVQVMKVWIIIASDTWFGLRYVASQSKQNNLFNSISQLLYSNLNTIYVVCWWKLSRWRYWRVFVLQPVETSLGQFCVSGTWQRSMCAHGLSRNQYNDMETYGSFQRS